MKYQSQYLIKEYIPTIGQLVLVKTQEYPNKFVEAYLSQDNNKQFIWNYTLGVIKNNTCPMNENDIWQYSPYIKKNVFLGT